MRNAVRLQLILLTNSVIDSDEGIVGLMAKHITEGKPWPVFYYGQNYMGSLEAILAAFSFTLLGRSNFTLKLVPLVFSLIQMRFRYQGHSLQHCHWVEKLQEIRLDMRRLSFLHREVALYL